MVRGVIAVLLAAALKVTVFNAFCELYSLNYQEQFFVNTLLLSKSNDGQTLVPGLGKNMSVRGGTGNADLSLAGQVHALTSHMRSRDWLVVFSI